MREWRLLPDWKRSSSLPGLTSRFLRFQARYNLFVARAWRPPVPRMQGRQAESTHMYIFGLLYHIRLFLAGWLKTAHPDPEDGSSPQLRAIPLSNSSASSTCDPHDLSLCRASATARPELRGTDASPASLENKDTERSFDIVNFSQWAHSAPHLSIECTGCVCPRVSETWDTEAHTSRIAC